MTAMKGKTMKLTAEQKQLLAEIMAKMQAENAAREKAKPRISLGLSHLVTEQYNHRLPKEIGELTVQMSIELNATRSYIVYTLLCYALTGKNTEDVYNILDLPAAKEYVSKQKD